MGFRSLLWLDFQGQNRLGSMQVRFQLCGVKEEW